MVNIKFVRFNSNHSAIIANLKTSLNKVIITVSYNVDMGSDGNIMPFYIYKIISQGNSGTVSSNKSYKNQTKKCITKQK